MPALTIREARVNFLLIHSPFLGPGVWEPLRLELIARGHGVSVPDYRAGLEDPVDPYLALARTIVHGARLPTTVVLHSGAGALAPSIWSADNRLTSMIFLDALTPHPGSSWLQTLPGGMKAQLLAASIDDRLPPWPRWLPEGRLEQLIPDSRLRRAISAEACCVPLRYAEAVAPDIPAWPQVAACSYIQLSDAYADQARMAARAGFSVQTYQGSHFSMVSAAPIVADLLIGSVAPL